ncbi:MAG: trigger factor [Alicyclobacillus sp.]|nr:trigger factor [Alicyclobacillus sp.]
MTAKWEKTEANVGVLEVEVDSEQFSAALDRAFKKVVKNVTVPGFRKGKVPRKLFESRFGVESLYQEAVDDLLPQVYQQAVQETGIEPVDRPSIDIVQIGVGEPLIFKATVTVKPEVQLGEYKGLEIKDQPFEVTDEAISQEVDRIRSSHAQIDVVEDGEVQTGDTVNIDFAGTVDGEPFEGGEAENYQLEIGSGMFIQGFEEQLIGMKPGEQREIQVTFPENYHVKSLAGRDAKFQVTLHDIKRRTLRELDDEFVQEISEFETVDAFMEDLKKNLAHRLEHEHEHYLQDAAVAAAVQNATVDIPQVMIDNEADSMVENFAQQLAMQQIPLDAYMEFTGTTRDELRSQFAESAKQSVLNGLVLEAIAKQEGLEPSDEDIEAELQKLAESSGLPLERVQQIMSLRDPGLAGLRSDLRTRKTVEFLVANSKVV